MRRSRWVMAAALAVIAYAGPIEEPRAAPDAARQRVPVNPEYRARFVFSRVRYPSLTSSPP